MPDPLPDPEPEPQLAEFVFPAEGEFVSTEGEYFIQDAKAKGVTDVSIATIDGGEGGWRLHAPEEMMPFAIGAVLEHEGGKYEEPPTEVDLLRAELENLKAELKSKDVL
jgi:hypothetical protein